MGDLPSTTWHIMEEENCGQLDRQFFKATTVDRQFFWNSRYSIFSLNIQITFLIDNFLRWQLLIDNFFETLDYLLIGYSNLPVDRQFFMCPNHNSYVIDDSQICCPKTDENSGYEHEIQILFFVFEVFETWHALNLVYRNICICIRL